MESSWAGLVQYGYFWNVQLCVPTQWSSMDTCLASHRFTISNVHADLFILMPKERLKFARYCTVQLSDIHEIQYDPLSISPQLAGHLSYNFHWPYRKVQVRQTPHRVAYHAESKVYVVAVSSYIVDSTDPTISFDTPLGNDIPSPDDGTIPSAQSSLPSLHIFVF